MLDSELPCSRSFLELGYGFCGDEVPVGDVDGFNHTGIAPTPSGCLADADIPQPNRELDQICHAALM